MYLFLFFFLHSSSSVCGHRPAVNRRSTDTRGFRGRWRRAQWLCLHCKVSLSCFKITTPPQPPPPKSRTQKKEDYFLLPLAVSVWEKYLLQQLKNSGVHGNAYILLEFILLNDQMLQMKHIKLYCIDGGAACRVAASHIQGPHGEGCWISMDSWSTVYLTSMKLLFLLSA